MRRRGWLILAVLLIAVAAVLMVYGEKEEPPPARPEVAFPRHLRQNEWQRMEQRRTLPAQAPSPAPTAGAPQPPPPERPRDPVLAALTASARDSAVVIEANALRHSPVGELFIDCISDDPDGENPLEELKQRAGVDVLQDLDRVALMDEGVLLSGNFSGARWGELLEERARPVPYGERATVYEPAPRTDESGRTRPFRRHVVSWNNQLLFIARDAASARAVVDQLEGRAPPRRPILDEGQTYGEIYGVLSARDLAELLPPEQARIAEQLRSAAERIELHVDASSDVGMVADVRGTDAAKVEDLGKSLGAALALARFNAQTEGEKNLAELLDLARIRPDGTQFKLEMALPLSVIEKQLAFCRQRRGQDAGH